MLKELLDEHFRRTASEPRINLTETLLIWGSRIFCSVFIFFSLSVAGLCFFSFGKVLESQHWPATPGKVTSSHLAKEDSRDHDPMYSVKVTYAYEVAGMSYTSDRVRFADTDYDWAEANSRLNLYPEGGPVQVYYNPIKPDEAVLESTFPWGLTIIPCIALFLATNGAAMFWFMPKMARYLAAQLRQTLRGSSI